MKHAICTLFVAFVLVPCSLAQETVHIDSNGSDIALTIWSADNIPSKTILALPGWGGGPGDVLGIGRSLSSEYGISVVVLSPRGWHASEGQFSVAGSFEDIAAALAWVRTSDRDDLNHSDIVLGGHSWGGGMSLAYAAGDTTVSSIFSVAGTDHGTLVRKYQSDERFAAMVNPMLASTAAPDGPIRFSVDDMLNELINGQETYGIRENAAALADRSILMFGGWEDVNTTIDEFLLPQYRSLKKSGAEDVTFIVLP